MSKIIFTMLLLSVTIMAEAKSVHGRVVEEDSTPIEFANVTAFVRDSVVNGTITDQDGLFVLELPDGCDRLRISFVGYEEAVLTNVTEEMGDIRLIQSSTTLKEVVIKAPLIRREADRIVLNVAANPLAANKDAQDLLKTAPGVWATDDALSIYGQEGTTVYIDDRKVNMSGTQLMTYLKSIQSSSIASIEIIPKAGAEYSADSSGGVVRINLKRNRVDGMIGSTGINLTSGEYKQWINPFANVSLHSGKWTFNLNGNLNGNPTERNTTHEESMNETSNISMNGVSRHKNKAIQGNVVAGIFFEPNSNDRLGLQVDYNPDRSRHTSDSRTDVLENGVGTVTTGRYVTNNLFHNLNVTLNWAHTLDDKGSMLKWISNYNYQQSNVSEDNIMGWSTATKDSIYTTDNRNRYNIFVTELSLEKALGERWRLNVGAKYTFNDVAYRSGHNYFDNGSWISNTPYDYDESYAENIAAVYTTANGQAGRWRLKVGLRGEYFKANGSLMSNSKFDLFPNANITFNLTERGDYTVSAGYYRNIRRPSFWSLNPTVRQVSDYSYSVGNPDLTPSYTNAVSLDFVLAGRFTVATGYSETSNPIRQMFVSNPEHPERMYLTWGNEGKDRNLFIHGDGFINITKWWNLYSSLTYMLTSQKLSADTGFDTFGYIQLVASTTFLLPKDFNITMSCFYNSRMRIGNITVYPILNLNPTIQKRFGQHWAVSLGLENMLQRTSKYRTSSSGYDRLTYTKTYLNFKVGVTYNFNSGKGFRRQRIENNSDNSRLSKE